jgi:hypothetical protein
MEGKDIDWNLEHLLGVGNLMKSNQVDAIVALDDYDVEKSNLSKREPQNRWYGTNYGTLLQG